MHRVWTCAARSPVVSVDGDLMEVESFVVLTGDGDRSTLVPEEGLATFGDGAPLSHLSEHIRSGVPVVVAYTRIEDGTLVAVAVDDAP